eukprot:c20549_g1_i1.p1 GENE.c20549_g1_i1~~c20549_g1_i1.p1  ORF type:complete len:876 (+),score=186.56 c20549_g1_i1:76-2703(+)
MYGSQLNESEEGNTITSVASHVPLMNGHGRLNSDGRPNSFFFRFAGAGSAPPPGLGTMLGVFVPTFQSMLGPVLFLRLGWIVGEQGICTTLGSFVLAFSIVILTTISISAVVTNGKVEAGGIYYIVSRSLGPEFGGSIGLAFCITKATAVSYNILAFVEILVDIVGDVFGVNNTTIILCTIVHVAVLSISLLGASLFTKVSAGMLSLILFSWLCAIIAVCVRTGRVDLSASIDHNGHANENGNQMFNATGLSWSVLKQNFGESGAHYTEGHSFLTIFPLFFTAIIGVFTGVNLSGDLADPTNSLPKGTFAALAASGVVHFVTMIFLGAAIPKTVLLQNKLIMQDIQWVPELVYVGIMISMVASALSSSVGAARVLHKIGKDHLLPGLHHFSSPRPNPMRATLLVFVISQLVMFMGSLDAVSPILSNFYLLTFATINLACIALKLSGAPNFRPTFRYSNKMTSLVGFVMCVGTMFAINPSSAAISLLALVLVFGLVTITAPPVLWGDVSQALIYHQVRKYLLKLDERKQHVRNWRPAVLALVQNPMHSHVTMQFGNQIKKGGLYVIGHYLYGDTEQLHDTGKYVAVRNDWLNFFQRLGIKAFVEISTGVDQRQAYQALLTHSGLGAMRPNTVIMDLLTNEPVSPFPNIKNVSHVAPISFVSTTELPTPPLLDSLMYMQIIGDVIRARLSLMISINFEKLQIVNSRRASRPPNAQRFIDVWLTYDVLRCSDNTMGMMLQLSHILSTQHDWEKLRPVVRVFLLIGAGTDSTGAKLLLTERLWKMRLTAHHTTFTVALPFYTIEPDSPEHVTQVREEMTKIVGEKSRAALVTFVPLWPFGDEVTKNREDSDQYIQNIREMTQNWGPTVMVHGAHNVVSY